jgi:hypothetical protein
MRLHLDTRRRAALAAAALAIAATTAPFPAPAATARPTDERFQAWLQQDVDASSDSMFAFAPFRPAERSRPMAHALLDGLQAQAAYRAWLHRWLDAQDWQAVASADEVVAAWRREYHRAFVDALEFIPTDDEMTLLWTLADFHAISALDRAGCDGSSVARMDAAAMPVRDRLLADHGAALTRDLIAALGREFARRNAPVPGDRQVPEIMVRITMASLRATIDSLPQADGKRLYDAYSYRPPAVSEEEECRRQWVVGRAVADSRVDDRKSMASGLLLRQQLTMQNYRSRFGGWDASGSRPPIKDFKPGKAVIATPEAMRRQSVQGTTVFDVQVDEAGRLAAVSIRTSNLPKQVTSIDGSTLVPDELVTRVVEGYLRAGSFEPVVVDGKAAPRRFAIEFDWR